MTYRVLTLVAVLLALCAVLFIGCAPKEEAAPELYWNADKGAERTPEADGSYQVLFIKDGQQITLRVANEALMTRIDKQDALGLVIQDGTVTDMISIMDMPYYYVTWNYYVQSFGGTTVKMNSERNFGGREVVVSYDENTKILDVSQFASSKGDVSALQKGDGATVVANPDGTINTVFIHDREGIFTTETRYCPVCDEEVTFSSWFSGAAMPFSTGHYYLEKDIELGMTTSVNSGEICLDLNGKTVTMVNEGQRFYTLGEGVILNVMDTVGGGRAVVASSGSGPYASGMFVQTLAYGSEFNMYSGTIDASNAYCQHGGVVDNYQGTFNMYGGTFLGATTYGVGGGCIIVQNCVNIYGGEIIGGDCRDYTIMDDNPPGGGCIRHNGQASTLNIYGGIIRDGKTNYNGGCLYVNGPVNIYGGTITGGSAEIAGGGICVAPLGSIILAGDAVVTDNIGTDVYLSEGRGITIAEQGLGNAKLGITMEKPGKFVFSQVPADKVSCFFATNGGKISRNGDGTLTLK